jgi:hypothetical protein
MKPWTHIERSHTDTGILWSVQNRRTWHAKRQGRQEKTPVVTKLVKVWHFFFLTLVLGSDKDLSKFWSPFHPMVRQTIPFWDRAICLKPLKDNGFTLLFWFEWIEWQRLWCQTAISAWDKVPWITHFYAKCQGPHSDFLCGEFREPCKARNFSCWVSWIIIPTYPN